MISSQSTPRVRLYASSLTRGRSKNRSRDLHHIENILGRYITGRRLHVARNFSPMPLTSPPPVDRILDYTAVAANALQEVATASQIPFLSRVCTLTLTIIPMVQSARFQKDRCLRIAEEIHHLLCVLMTMSIHLEDIQSPELLNHVADFAATLQKFDSCLRAQRDFGTIKRLFKQSEITVQLDRCEAELKETLANFNMKQAAGFVSTLVGFNLDAERRHQELLELIASQSDSIDHLSSIGRSPSHTSSGSFSLLPASPKIFYGRESELEHLISTLLSDPARVAILGPGGMGKTTLAMAALHDPKVAEKYQARYFISCDSASTADSLAVLIAFNLGLEAALTSGRAVVHHLATGPPCLVILDNFETPWEPMESRGKVEEFLSLLTDVPQAALLITMRGTERPSKIQWSHPFMPPLMPLPPVAARQTFIEIADQDHDDGEVDQLLGITDNVPLVVQLVATIAAYDGCQAALERWYLEKTALLSAGCDKRSNLELSIRLSLSSPRMLGSPHATELLSLMSLLSDGISDVDLLQSKLPMDDVLKCKSTLVRTSLAYVDYSGRLKVLAPIREYVQTARPPAPSLVRPVRKHLHDLLKLRIAHGSLYMFEDLMPRLISNLGNLHNVLLYGLDHDYADIRATIKGIISLISLNIAMNRGLSPLMLRLPELLSGIDDHGLHGHFIIVALQARQFHTIPDLEKSMHEAIEHFRAINNCDGEAQLHNEIATYYLHGRNDLKKAESFFRSTVSLALQCNSSVAQVQGLIGLMEIAFFRGNYSEGLQLAHETRKIAVAAGDVWGECGIFRWQAAFYLALGNFKHSIQSSREGKEFVTRTGLQGGAFETGLMNREAEVYQLKTEYTEARRIHNLILRQTSAVLSPVSYAYALANIALIDTATGASTADVSRNLDAASVAFRNAQTPRGVSVCELIHADLLLREGQAEDACTEYMRLFSGLRSSDDELACLCLARLADPTRLLQSDAEVARWGYVFLAFTLRASRRNWLAVHQALRCLGDVFARQSADDAALNILMVALDGFMLMDVLQSRAECMRTIGHVYVRHGDLHRAREMWEAARPLFERSEQTKEVAGIDKNLQTLAVAQKLQAMLKVELPTPEAPSQKSGAHGDEQRLALIPNL